MNNLKTLMNFLYKLEDANIYYSIRKPSSRPRECIMVEVIVPGQRWEVEFFEDEIQIEVYRSDGRIYDESHLDVLFADYSD